MRWIHGMEDEGPPCRHMETFLQCAADGSAGPVVRWYANAHAARCKNCQQFLNRLVELREKLATEAAPPEEDVLERLAAGDWRRERN
jgi:predicted anti-sigma-YlaC factor YlaD